jgi:hypothetical protein
MGATVPLLLGGGILAALDGAGKPPRVGVGAADVLLLAITAVPIVLALFVLVAGVVVARAPTRLSLALRTLALSILFAAASFAVVLAAAVAPGTTIEDAPAGDLGPLGVFVMASGLGMAWLCLSVVSAIVAPFARRRDRRAPELPSG